MNSDQTLLILQGDNSQFSQLLPEIDKFNLAYKLVKTVEEAMVHISQNTCSVLLADLIVDGVEITGFIESINKLILSRSMRIVVFSSQTENYVEIAVLNAGADDFMVKPVNKYVFHSRLNAWLRQHKKREKAVLDSPDKNKVVLDPEKYLAFVNSQPVDLQRKEFEIISLLLSRPRKVFSRAEIIKKIWAQNQNVNERTIDVHIRNLRTKLGTRRIRTYKGVGYSYDAI